MLLLFAIELGRQQAEYAQYNKKIDQFGLTVLPTNSLGQVGKMTLDQMSWSPSDRRDLRMNIQLPQNVKSC